MPHPGLPTDGWLALHAASGIVVGRSTRSLGSMREGVVIRAIEPRDSLQELTDLLHRAYASLGRMGLNYTAVDQPSERTARRISRGQCFVAAEGTRLIGTIVVEPTNPDSPCEYFVSDGVASAHQLAVAPENQRSGLGVALLERAEAWARDRGFRELALDTAEPAEQLRSFYERRGYRHVGFVQWQRPDAQSDR